MTTINNFNTLSFIGALKAFFTELSVPVNYIDDKPTSAKAILTDTYKDKDPYNLIGDVYFLGIVDDAAFNKSASIAIDTIKKDYDGILIFGIELTERGNDLLPTRSQLAEISRAFNRQFYFTPVIIVYKYNNSAGSYISLAHTERMEYKQEWREGEKACKVSILRDVNIARPHSGHIRILSNLDASKGKDIASYAALYKYWQQVFSVSLLNKKFYKELSDWYFWARGEVRFPSEPLRLDFESEDKYKDAIDEHNGKNVIRLLTRILFIWFIKEKNLIPSEIFDEDYIADQLIEDFTPQKPQGVFATAKHKSKYYRAILQNLFFATLNCEKGKREFRKEKTHMNVTYLMRYKSYFKNPKQFLKLMEDHVPFMNGGLFECLDKPHEELRSKQGGDKIIYFDGFSDREDNVLNVPDFLFFDKEEVVDLSAEYGDKKQKNITTKGLLKILESYKFTITENTPIEEDIALDPELLGKVFENLLASYNPETKTTARKQTGSFYTPREIVNYMVDESLIAYLKNSVNQWGNRNEDTIDQDLHSLCSFDNNTAFEEDTNLKKEIIAAIDNCKILDPACGSGAFPMGILQKMVHILHKVDPNNEEWKQRQLSKIDEAIAKVEEVEDAATRDKIVIELKEQKQDVIKAFDNNELDYGRKLFLIENCIYGVDIQSIATQISKLRFFISLIVDQKIDKSQDNFGIRPLPNLETKFVAANTLIDIDKKPQQASLFDNQEVSRLENDLKKLNKRIFSIKSPSTKRELRDQSKQIRDKMAELLEEDGLDNATARTLASWDPYDQNASSPFFNTEWMFDIKDGFDVVIGNPPYVQMQANGGELANIYKKYSYKTFERTGDIYSLFYERGIEVLAISGVLTYITSNKWMRAGYGESTRAYFCDHNPLKLIDMGSGVFESATVDTNILLIEKSKSKPIKYSLEGLDLSKIKNPNFDDFRNSWVLLNSLSKDNWTISNSLELSLKQKIESKGKPLKEWDIKINYGIKTGYNEAFIIDGATKDRLIEEDPKSAEILKPILRGRDIKRYKAEFADLWLIYVSWHFPIHNKPEIKGSSLVAENEFKIQYPAIYKHLLSHKEKLSARNKAETGIRYEWYALQRWAADYYIEFEKEKIIFQEMVQSSSFVYDENEKLFCLDTGRIITGNNLKDLLLVMNSKLFFYCVKYYYGGGALGETGIRMKHTFFEKFPMVELNEKRRKYLIKLVDQILSIKSQNQDTTALEHEIDVRVYHLYELTYEEAFIIDPGLSVEDFEKYGG